jgi:spore germination cell wall hydrolase CwlJ-like protein
LIKSDVKRQPLWARVKNGFFPVVAGVSLFLTYPTLVAHQDVASLSKATASVTANMRWLISADEEPGVSQLTTGSTSNSPVEMVEPQDAVFAAALGGKDITKRLTSEVKISREPQTVNRSGKGDRVVSTTKKAPPAKFNAGTVAERYSMLAPLDVGKKTELAFVKAKPAAEALQVAFAFHSKKKKQDKFAPKADLPVMVASLVKESVPNILAYASEPEFERSPFAEVLEETGPINIIPKLEEGDHSWAANPLPKAAFSKREQHCLTAGIYFEARGEPVRGQAAVSQVILNRVKNPTYPDTICGVVYQNKHWRNRCQFSFACDNIKDKVNDPKRWEVASYVARETTEGRIWFKEVGSSTHYHATYVNPKWAHSMKKVGRIGLHIFYRTFGGGWS